MAFKRHHRQRIIDGYLAATGRNMFIPGEFVDWLEGQPEHQSYPLFFGRDDAELAREARINIARRMAAGLRIVCTTTEDRVNVVTVTTREFPAMISPLTGRGMGGGYVATDPSDPAHMAELRRQGASALRSWLARYRGAFEAGGHDLSAVEALASAEDVALSA